MRTAVDYFKRMFKPGITNARAEAILSGEHRSDGSERELSALVAEIRALTPRSPSDPYLPTDLASIVRQSQQTKFRAGGRLVFLAATVGLLLAMAGMAMASDDSYPGHPLYGIDIALERIGIGSGGPSERIAEAGALLEQGRENEAEKHLRSLASNRSQHQAADPLPSFQDEAADHVAEKKSYIEENKGKGTGTGGAEFGHGVASLALGQRNAAPPGPAKKPTEGAPGTQPEEAAEIVESADPAPANAAPRRSDTAGPKDQARSNPDTGPGDPQESGSGRTTEPSAQTFPKDSVGPKDQ